MSLLFVIVVLSKYDFLMFTPKQLVYLLLFFSYIIFRPGFTYRQTRYCLEPQDLGGPQASGDPIPKQIKI